MGERAAGQAKFSLVDAVHEVYCAFLRGVKHLAVRHYDWGGEAKFSLLR